MVILSVEKNDNPLRIYVLSNSRGLYSTRRFFEEAFKKGHSVKVFPPVALSLSIEKNKCSVFYEKNKINLPDIIIPRVGQKKTSYTMAVIKHMEINGATTLNNTQGILRSRDKLRSLQVLAQNGMPVPKTFFLDTIDDIDLALEVVGGAPIIIKVTEGTQGMGVMLGESVRSTRSIIESLLNQGQHVLVQEFIKEATGRDIRAIVLDDRVIASMQRSSIGDEFRSNVHRGGQKEKHSLSLESERMAKMAVRSLGLRFAGVDLIESERGPLLLEVNPSPGLEGIEETTGINIAEIVIRYLQKMHRQARRPKR